MSVTFKSPVRQIERVTCDPNDPSKKVVEGEVGYTTVTLFPAHTYRVARSIPTVRAETPARLYRPGDRHQGCGWIRAPRICGRREVDDDWDAVEQRETRGQSIDTLVENIFDAIEIQTPAPQRRGYVDRAVKRGDAFEDEVERLERRRDVQELVARLTEGNRVSARDPEHVRQRNRADIDTKRTHVALVGCSDLCVPASTIVDPRYVDTTFESKTAGGCLSAADIESVRHAVEGSKHAPHAVIVMGHGGCAAIAAAVEAVLDEIRTVTGIVPEDDGDDDDSGKCRKRKTSSRPRCPTIVRDMAPAVRLAWKEAGAGTRKRALKGDEYAIAAIADTASVINVRARAARLAETLVRSKVPVIPAFYDQNTGRVRWFP